jgi:hypothetical protein
MKSAVLILLLTAAASAAPPVLLQPGEAVLVQRCLLPDISSRVVAASLPGGVSIAFDAATCRLATAWTGGFLDMKATWTGRGAGPPVIIGSKFFTAPPGGPLRIGASENPPVKFLGYHTGKEKLELRYEVAGVPVTETLSSANGSLTRRFQLAETKEPVRFQTGHCGTLTAGQPGPGGWAPVTVREFTHTIPLTAEAK